MKISASILAELDLLFSGLVLGGILMVSYDILRIIRILIPHRRFFLDVEDFCYWFYAAWMTFSLLFYKNSGEVRTFVIAAVFLGMMLYDHFISRFLLRLLHFLIEWITLKLISYKLREEAQNYGSQPKKEE